LRNRVVCTLQLSQVHGLAFYYLFGFGWILRLCRLGTTLVLLKETSLSSLTHIISRNNGNRGCVTDVAHDKLDGTTGITGFGIAHLAFLGAYDRASPLSEKFKHGNLACAV
jgi:hypothetical protein